MGWCASRKIIAKGSPRSRKNARRNSLDDNPAQPVEAAAIEDSDKRNVVLLRRGFGRTRQRALRIVSATSLAVEAADAEINPLIVKEKGHGVVAVDGLVVFE